MSLRVYHKYDTWEAEYIDHKEGYSYNTSPYSNIIITKGMDYDKVEFAISRSYCKDLCPYSDDCVNYQSSELCARSKIMKELKKL